MTGEGVFSVELTKGALGDVRAIKAYIEEQLLEPAAARRTVERILAAADALSTMPRRNRVLVTTSSGYDVRLARAGNYSLLYLIAADAVRVFAVMYSARDFESRLPALLARA